MSEPLDVELGKALMELQTKMAETHKKIQVIDGQIGLLKRALQHTDFARHEIGTLPAETKAYKSVGRMFLLTDLSEVRTNLDDKISTFSTRAAELEAHKQSLEVSLRESEESLKEMIQQHKELTEKKST